MAKNLSLRAVLCDLDGTLVNSALNFAEIRRDLRVPDGLGILEHLQVIQDPQARSELELRLHEHELSAARKATWIQGVPDFLEFLSHWRLPLGIVTRNSKLTAAETLKKFSINAEILVSRDDAAPKPDPEGVIKCLSHFGIAPEEAVFIGDYHYDLDAGRAAGVATILYAPVPRPEFSHRADYVVDSWAKISALLASWVR